MFLPLIASHDDATIDVLVPLSNLNSLTLDEAWLSRRGLERLRALPRLKKVGLRWIDILADDVAALRSTWPSVIISCPLIEEERTKLDTFLRP